MADTLIYAPIRSMTGDGKSAYASQIWDEEQQKFQSEINKETANDGLVSAKTEQSFSNSEKRRARTNINAYAKPDSGIPKSDMANGVKQSLDKADSSLQGITQEEFNQIFN